MIAYKLAEKISDPCNAKEHYQSFIRKKNTKSAKQSEIIAYQPKTFENPNIVDIKSVIIEHPETWHNCFKTTSQVKNVSQADSNSCLYSDVLQVDSTSSLHSDTKKVKIFQTKKT